MRHRNGKIALFALTIALVSTLAPQAVATTGYSIGSDFDDNLYRVELETGAKTKVGAVGFGDVEGLAFDASGALFGFDDATDQLLRIDPGTGAGTGVGPSGITVTDVGLDFNCQSNPFLSIDAPTPFNLHQLNVATGAATVIGPQGVQVTGLGTDGKALFGITGDGDNRTVILNTATGAIVPVGPTGLSLSDGGLAGAPDGTLWGVVDSATGEVFTLNKQTGAATVRSKLEQIGFESLAIDAPSLCAPPTASVVAGPEGVTKVKAPSFGFNVGGQPVGRSVLCAIDGVFGPCSGADTHQASLADGAHTFAVRVTNRDAIQATSERSFSIDTKAPQTIIKKVRIDDDDVKVRFRSNEKGSTFQCRIDRKKFRKCRSPRVFKNLDEGKHRIRVRAIDLAGNVDKTPAKRKLKIEE